MCSVLTAQLTDLQQALDSLPWRHHDGRHHAGEEAGHGELVRAQHRVLVPLLHLLTHRVGVEADGEDGGRANQGSSHACKVVSGQPGATMSSMWRNCVSFFRCRKTLTFVDGE